MAVKIKTTLQILGGLSTYLYPKELSILLRKVLDQWYTGRYRNDFASFGHGSTICYKANMLNDCNDISIGHSTWLGKNIQLTAWKSFQDQDFSPFIKIGNFCCIRDNAHITAINSVQIGDNVLTGTNVLITDNTHGNASKSTMNIRPELKTLSSKGAVAIEDKVWLGNNVCIIVNVSIGKGSIIGANSVVTSNVPPYSVAVGTPARVIKTFNE